MSIVKFSCLGLTLLLSLVNVSQCDDIAIRVIDYYNNYLSHSKADTCKMYPSCSAYARQALSSNNFIVSLMIITDRLYRSDHDSEKYQKVWVNGRLKLYDPNPGFYRDSSHLVEDKLIIDKFPCHSPENCTDNAGTLTEEIIRQFNYAERLQEVGRYDDAFWEYERMMAYYPNSSLSICAQMNAFMCLYDDGEYLRAIHYADGARRKAIIDTSKAEFYSFWVAASYARLKNSQRAINELESSSFSGDFADREPMLRAYAWASQNNWGKAQSVFSDVSDDSDYKERAESAVTKCRDELRYSPKSPVLAGGLALIPGLGYLYAGYEQSAISAAVLTGLFGWAAIKAAEDGNDPLAVAVGLIGMGWYMGNIYGSVNAALISNEEHNRRALLELDLGFRF